MTSNTRRKLNCAEADAMFDSEGGRYVGWSVYSSLTDIHGAYGDPRIETSWVKDGVIVKTIRHPNPQGGEDLEPCEHYTFPEPIEDED